MRPLAVILRCRTESLVQLVRAICGSGGPIPRPPSSSMPWDASELCLELLFTVLLRNRDRITLLWPRAYEHFAVGGLSL
jgi:brefeldin A-resistance guanine nucleotide exchange factor 1